MRNQDISITLFGQLVDIVGSSHLTFEAVDDTNTLMQHLYNRYPALAATKHAIAVDKKIVRENTPLNKGTTVALLPPFSGG